MTPDPIRSGNQIMYHADTGFNLYNLWEPFTADQLTQHIDDFVDNGIDIFSQLTFAGGTLKPGLFVPEHPEFAWWPNEKFRKLVDSGVQPLDIMIDRAHQRGMKFFCKLRMSDWHQRTAEESGFVGRHPEFQNPTNIVRPSLDYAHREVRDYHNALIEELVRRFDIDGITLNFTRSWLCFPKEVGGQRHELLTAFIEQVRHTLDEQSQAKGKRIELCVIILPHLKLCESFGIDVATWIHRNIIDYVCPGNTGFSDPNMDHEVWSSICRQSQCRYFPMLQNIVWSQHPALIKPEHIRGIAKGMYDGGADGISVFNWQYYWMTRGGRDNAGSELDYPLALTYLRDLRDPAKLDQWARKYHFRPIGSKWDTAKGIFEDSYRLTLPRRVGVRHEYHFRLPEEISKTGGAYLLARILGMAPPGEEAGQQNAKNDPSAIVPGLSFDWPDEIELDINGTATDPAIIQRAYHAKGRDERFGRPLAPYSSIWFRLNSPPAKKGQNALGLRMVKLGNFDSLEIVVEEVEVAVMPPAVKT